MVVARGEVARRCDLLVDRRSESLGVRWWRILVEDAMGGQRS
jgi:hypothetical protein